jgi:hypothetical protein
MKKALELKPVKERVLVILDRLEGPITTQEFFAALFRSFSIRWKLRKAVFPENPPSKEITDYECGGCGNMVNPNVHGDCPRCYSMHLFYIGHDFLLPSIESPKGR